MKTLPILTFLIIQAITGFSQEILHGEVCVKKGDKTLYGVILNDGSELIPIKYDFICYNGLVFVYELNDKYGFIDTTGKVITDPIFEDFVYNSSESFIRAKKNGKWGFVDQFGKTKIDFQYNAACNFHNGEAHVEVKNAVLVINKKGEVLKRHQELNLEECEEDYSEIISFNEIDDQDRFIVKTVAEKKGVIEKKYGTETTIIPYEYDLIIYHEHLFLARKNNLWSVYTEKGVLLFDSIFYRPPFFGSF